MDITIQVRNRGVITLPADCAEKYGIENGDLYRLVDLDGVFVLTPMVPMVPELAREIEQARLETGLSVAELLQGTARTTRALRSRNVWRKRVKAPRPRVFHRCGCAAGWFGLAAGAQRQPGYPEDG